MKNVMANDGLDTSVFFKDVLDGLTTGAIFVDKSRVIRYCNNAAESIFGYSSDELIGKKTDVLYGDRRKDKSHAGEIQNWLSDHGYHVGEASGTRKDGRSVSLNIHTFMIKEGAGAAIVIKEAKGQTVDMASLLQDLIDNIPDMIYFKNAENRFIMVNKSHAEALGLSPDEVLNKTDLDLFPKEIAGKYFDDDNKVVKTGKPIMDKVTAAPRPDGGITYVSTTKIPRFDRNGNVIGTIGITRNVTERVTAEEELRKYKNRLEELVSERTRQLEDEREKLLSMYNVKSDFVATVSHELRTPITVIRGNVDIVSDGTAGPVNEKQKKFLDVALKSIDRLTRLIGDILDLSKLESGKMKYRVTKANPNELIGQVVKSYEVLAGKRGLLIDKELDPSLPLVDLDRDRINQVLCNLLTNAMKFTASGRILVGSKTDGDNIRVTVEDTGCGIRKDDICRIFERFEQVSMDDGARGEGTGLGLAICKQIVEQLGGRIWAESEFGKGSSFIFTLPLNRQKT